MEAASAVITLISVSSWTSRLAKSPGSYLGSAIL
jgi:hypothetical protein